MKHSIFQKLAAGIIILSGLSACDDREIVTIDTETTPVLMDLSKSSLVLDPNFPANPALTITWKSAKTTVPVELKYNLEISANKAFTNSKVLASTNQSQTNLSFTFKDLNEAAKSIGLVAYQAQNMYFRVTSLTTSNQLAQVSNITNLMLTPYLASPTYPYSDLFLIGNAAVGNWDNAASNNTLLPLLKTSSANVYTYTGLFKMGTDVGFKIIKVKGSWDAQFGFGSPGNLSTSGGSGNLTVPEEGYYKLTIDTSALSFSLVKIPNPAVTYTTVSLFGTSTLSTDIQLTKSTFDPHSWSASKVTLKEGVFKFRANNSGTVNWGTNSEFFGVGVNGGADIPVSAEWQYDIYFNDISGSYTFIPVK
ncbi:SusE domain-containing protein [Epilithonimonas tenax]|uniref:SusE domain-containing protein n=1 Tax=Epilithonimonas tenax TaxID=191577 RepID=UPI000419154A|nr:SusE domain-containing protein [Epilithonimonas tenax]